MEFPLGYREVVPDQTLPEKWKEITLNTGLYNITSYFWLFKSKILITCITSRLEDTNKVFSMLRDIMFVSKMCNFWLESLRCIHKLIL